MRENKTQSTCTSIATNTQLQFNQYYYLHDCNYIDFINQLYYKPYTIDYYNNRLSYYYNINNNFSFNYSNTLSSFGGLYEDYNIEYKYTDNKEVSYINDENILSSFPTNNFIKSSNIIYVPNKLIRILDRYVSVKELSKIDNDIDTAKEFCLMFLSLFSKSYYLQNTNNGWLYMSKYYMCRYIFGTDSQTAKKKLNKIIEIMINGTSEKGAIIEINKECEFSFVKRLANEYRLTDRYIDKGFKKYELKTKKAIANRQKSYYAHLSNICDNTVVKNLFKAYSMIELPSEGQIIQRAKELIKTGYSKHGKVLKFRNKKAKELDDKNKFIYAEDSIEVFKYLTEDGLLLPTISSDKAGGRVTDSINLMPSWIRQLIKINGRFIAECDYSCLHPNIAVALYSGYTTNITHQLISDETGIDKSVVKKEHLSFFNRNVHDMKTKPLYSYYIKKEHDMMQRIVKEKYQYGYKETSRKMFTCEVNIMSDVIKQLNEKHIYVLYVYDALACSPKHVNTVMSVMNETIQKYGVNTTAHN